MFEIKIEISRVYNVQVPLLVVELIKLATVKAVIPTVKALRMHLPYISLPEAKGIVDLIRFDRCYDERDEMAEYQVYPGDALYHLFEKGRKFHEEKSMA